MKTKLIIFFCICLISYNSQAKQGLLDYVVTVTIKEKPIWFILQTIEKYGQVKFSYNPDIIKADKIVSINIVEKTIRQGLNQIFDNRIRFKEVGKHIVLLENETKSEKKANKKIKTHFLFKGRIRDKLSGSPISSASIYDVDSRFAVLSDENGNYNLEIPVSERIRSLYFSKRGYRKIVLVLKTDDESNLTNDIELIPNETEITKITPTLPEQIPQKLEDRALSGMLISEEVYSHTENLEDINESRLAQISLVPSLGIGSNLSTNGLVTNNFSLNILSGYSKGLNGIEFGGIANIIKGEVRGLQAGGISNVVGGGVVGLQAAGIVNLVKLDYYGLQTAGIANVCRSHYTGLQVSGILNSVSGYVYGMQVSGIGNDVNGGFKGFQVAGIVNSVKKDMIGFQVSTFANAVRGRLIGLQVSGFTNIAVQDAVGLQIAGIQNVARHSLHGGQISGLFNFAKDGTNFFQATGLLNYSNKNNGLQTAGLFNYVNTNNGLQVGLINISKETNGVAIGLINFVANGYHKTEVSTNETSHLNITLKSGAKHFYNIYEVGMRFEDQLLYTLGLGFGSNITLSEKTSLSIDLKGSVAFKTPVLNFELDEYAQSQLHKFALSFDYQPTKWITVFAGPTFNVNIVQYNLNYTAVDYNSIYRNNFDDGHVNLWVGGQFGIRM